MAKQPLDPPTVYPPRARFRGPSDTLMLNTFRNQLLYDLVRLDESLHDQDERIRMNYLYAWLEEEDLDTDFPAEAELDGDAVSFIPMLELHRRLQELEAKAASLLAADL